MSLPTLSTLARHILLIGLLSLLAGPAMAAITIHENGQYQRITPPLPSQVEDGKIEVVELFFYACPHCYRLDPKMREWLKTKPDDVVFRRVPAILGPTWADQARAYYIAEALGMLDTFHEAFFNDIHKNGKQYYNRYTITHFLVEQGADEAEVARLYDSPEITEKVSQARVETVKAGVRGVPAILVNGSYKTASFYTRTLDEMLEVVDFLIERARTDNQLKTAANQESSQ